GGSERPARAIVRRGHGAPRPALLRAARARRRVAPLRAAPSRWMHLPGRGRSGGPARRAARRAARRSAPALARVGAPAGRRSRHRSAARRARRGVRPRPRRPLRALRELRRDPELARRRVERARAAGGGGPRHAMRPAALGRGVPPPRPDEADDLPALVPRDRPPPGLTADRARRTPWRDISARSLAFRACSEWSSPSKERPSNDARPVDLNCA